MIIPPTALPYTKLHRTGIGGDLGLAYARAVGQDFDQMFKFLPVSCKTALDIGCGLAGIDVFLWEHYGGNLKLVLLDGTGTVEDQQERIGFRDSMQPYNDMDVTAELLLANGVPPSNAFFYPVSENVELMGIPERSIDLIISLLSWGHHYPVETYLGLAQNGLSDTGRLILDVRHGTGGRELLEQHFDFVGTVRSNPKSDRLCWKRKAQAGMEFKSDIFT